MPAGSLALLWALWPLAATTLGKAGLIFLFLAALGQVIGGAFDINGFELAHICPPIRSR